MSRSVFRLVPLALAAGALIVTAFPAAAIGHHHSTAHHGRSVVALGAIQYDSPGRDNRSARSLNAEWVTVTNTGRTPVNLRNWTLANADHHRYAFRSLRLGAHKSVKVHTGVGRDTSRDLYQDRTSHMWGNGSDTATLRDSRGRTVDVKAWGRHHR